MWVHFLDASCYYERRYWLPVLDTIHCFLLSQAVLPVSAQESKVIENKGMAQKIIRNNLQIEMASCQYLVQYVASCYHERYYQCQLENLRS